MTIDKYDIVDMTALRDNLILLLIIESREWPKIKNATTKLFIKISNYKNYIKSNEFRKRYKTQKIKIILNSKYNPPQVIKNMLKKEGVILSVKHSKLKTL